MSKAVVEPEKILFGARGQVVVEAAEGIGILCSGIAAGVTAVESDSYTIGIMIIGRHPVGPCTRNVAPRFGTVMVSPGKEVMQAQWHHVVNNRFTALEHHPAYRLYEICIIAEGLFQPFVCYFSGRE